MALIDKNMVNDITQAISEKVDEGTKKATNMKKFELGFEVIKELGRIGEVTPAEEGEFLKKLLKQLGFNV